MKGSISNKEDIKKATETKGGNAFIKTDKKTFIRILSKDFVTEFSHIFKIKGQYKSMVCLGGVAKGGYAPDICPACAEGKKHWDRIKELKQNPNFETSNKLKAEADFEKKKGKLFQPAQKIVIVAVKGEAVKVKEKGTIKEIPEWEKEAKFLSLTNPQWKKITETVFKDYPFMKTTDDILNRNFMFLKEEKQGKNSAFSEVKIVPSSTTSKAPKIEGDLPDLDKVFVETKEADAQKIVRDFVRADGGEIDETEEDEIEDIDEDDEEEKPSKKSSKKSAEKPSKKSKKGSDEEPF